LPGRSADTESDGQTASPGKGAQTAAERKQGLDRQLDNSITEVDAMLLREQEVLAAQRESGGGGASGGGGGGAGSGADGSDTAGGAQGRSGPDNTTGGSPDSPAGEAVQTAAGAPEGDRANPSDDGAIVPPDVGDGRDDDIVARQLREAAQKEKDPELREKLWQEYRDYKKATAGKKNSGG
jgi:hypothetical protein